MKVVRLYTGADSRSHFEETEARFTGAGIATTEIQNASSVVFRSAAVGHVIDWHPAPRRQYVVSLAGQWEIECSDGVRLFKAGDVMLAEDLTGKGHISRVVGNEPHIFMTVPLK
jgi:quercetin dioxygenase-like cupin family protein